MKVLLYGKDGWIGNQVYNLLNLSNHEVIIGKCRAESTSELEQEILSVKPTNIISLIGRTHGNINNKVYSTIDYLEQPGKLKENVRDNLYSPITLAILAQKNNIHYTYLGTGCIFKFEDPEYPFGREENGFTEQSVPNFFDSSYSIMKGYTDRLMHLFEDNVLNIRIRMPITGDYNKRNFITKIITYNKICSVPNSMTVLPELLPILIDMADKKVTGTVNLTNPGLINHNEILEMYKEIVDPNFTWTNFSIEEQNKILASGRSNNFLDTTRLQSMYNIKNIKDSVRDMLYLMKDQPKDF
jgi:3,5-epimerase/4-reductase